MKTKSIFALTLAIAMLSACNKDDVDGGGPGFSDDAVAYLSITIPTDGTRASDEDKGTESDIKSLYLFTFDSNGQIIAIPGTAVSYFATAVLGTSPTSPEPQKIAAKATQLLVIANPSGGLLSSFSSINSSTTFALFNAAIIAATRADITDVASGSKGFTMINSGEEGISPVTGQVISNPLIDITDKAVRINGTSIPDENAAIAEADANRVKVKIERLASKIQLKEKATGVTPPANASFDLKSWVIDGLNTTFYPYPKKTLLDVGHNSTFGYYIKNFYTEDPNFTSGAGLDFATANRAGDYQPVFTQDMAWNTSTTSTTNIMYCIENTMAAAEQKFGNATRLVIKATYYPNSTWTGDWFSFGGVHYETLLILQDAYKVPGNVNLKAACDRMYNDIKAYLSTAGTPLAGTKTGFEYLEQSDLDLLKVNGTPIGGEVVKSQKDQITGVLFDCIRWYQEGLCYYFNEIRHDDETTQTMAFGKYGVVRNNWYELTLASVKGPGTPWYPDVENPGPGDPDPDDDIDDEAGYLGIEIEVAPWILWKKEIEI